MRVKKLILIIILILIFSFKLLYSNDYKNAKFLLKQGKVQKSKELFYKYYNENSNSYLAPFALHEYAKLEDDFNKIIKLFFKIEDKYPNYPQLDKVYFHLASIYLMLNDYKNSEKYFKKLVLLFTKSKLQKKAVYFWVKSKLLEEKYDDAINIINAYSRKNTNLLLLKGKIYLSKNEFSKAIDIFQRLSESNDLDKSQLFYYLIKAYRMIGENKKSIQLYSNLKQNYPKSIWTLSSKKLVAKIDNANKLESNSKSTIENNIKKESFYIQLGVFSSKKNALKIYSKAKSLNIICSKNIVRNNRRTLIRLVAGPYYSSKKVLEDRDKLNDNGLETVILKGK